MTQNPFAGPEELARHALAQLGRAVADSRHGFHWPALAAGGTARVVVLRRYDPAARTWRFYTDARSPKVQVLAEAGGRCEGLFYDGKRRLQLRLRGVASRNDDAGLLDDIWRGLPAKGKLSYAGSEAPGATLPEGERAWSATWLAGEPTPEEDAAARANFRVYEVAVEHFDALSLAGGNNQRAAWTDDAAGARWLYP